MSGISIPHQEFYPSVNRDTIGVDPETYHRIIILNLTKSIQMNARILIHIITIIITTEYYNDISADNYYDMTYAYDDRVQIYAYHECRVE